MRMPRIWTYSLLLLGLVSSCATDRKAQQKRINAAYEARTEASRAPARTNRPAGAAMQPSSQPATATGAAERSSGWVITSIKGKFQVADSSTLQVFMDLTVQSPETNLPTVAALADHFQVAYVIYPDYNNRERIGYANVPLTEQNLTRIGDHYRLTFLVKQPEKNPDSALLLTEVTERMSGAKARNDLWLRFAGQRLSDRLALYDPTNRQPLLRHYVHVGDTVLIGDASGRAQRLTGVRYRHTFDAAASPMNTNARPATPTLAVDSSLTLETNTPFVVPAEGLYYFSTDSTAENGIGLLVTDRRFPKLMRPEQLIKPVLYMSTSSEMNEMNQAKDAKKALDRYWLSLMGGNEELARRSIRAFYQRVGDANRLFTTYKEGWKTDKGMIYIVLGPPDRIQRNREREVWVYSRQSNASEVNFTFVRKPNQFVDDHYELMRYSEYQPIWYPNVEAWRTGTVRE